MAGKFRLFDLNPQQQEAVRATEGPVLILAGAGTGKTRVITARMAYLVHQGVDPANILAVTFTNKAANEMRGRVAELIDPDRAKQATIGTFHALCVRILRGSIDRLGYKNNFTIYAENDQLGLLRKIITRTAAREEKLDPNLARALISRAKNDGLESPPETDGSLLADVFRRFNADLKKLNAVDFDDLLLLAVKLLREHDDVRQKWRARFRYLMVDEFQDTNRLQLDLVRLLAGSPPNVCVVGDDDQSIYSWRGAETANILEFERHFPNPTVIKLEQNYRSTNAILHTANSLIANNPRRRPKNLWSQQGGGDTIRVIPLPDDRIEAEFVVSEIQRRQLADNLPWEHFAVLYRMNAQSRLFEENLRRQQIPYRIVGGKSFFDRREVKDLIAYANVLLNPDDDISLLRIVNTPARGIGDPTVALALHESIAEKTSLNRMLRSPGFQAGLSQRARGAIAAFSDLLERYERLLERPLTGAAVTLDALLKEIGYAADLARTCKTPEESLARETNLRAVLDDLRDFEARGRGSLRAFLDGLALDGDKDKDEEPDRQRGVTLITLHAAKGLEFPHVFLVGLEEGILPHERSKLEGTLDEERRLFYVGITRAMKSLTLTRAGTRMKFGSAVHCQPSSFLKELAADHVEHCDHADLLSRPATEADAKSGFARMRAMLGVQESKTN